MCQEPPDSYSYCEGLIDCSLASSDKWYGYRSNGVEMENLVIQGCKVASGWTAGVIINAPVLHNISAGENVNSILFKVSLYSDNTALGAIFISSFSHNNKPKLH